MLVEGGMIGRWVGVHLAGVGDVGTLTAGSCPIAPPSAADQIAPFVLLLALVNATIRSYRKQRLQIHSVVQGFEMASTRYIGMDVHSEWLGGARPQAPACAEEHLVIPSAHFS